MQIGTLGLTNYLVKILYRYHAGAKADKYYGGGVGVIMKITFLLAGAMALASSWMSRTLVDTGVNPHLFLLLAVYLVLAQYNNLAVLYLQTRVQYKFYFVMVISRWMFNMAVLMYGLLVAKVGFYSWVWAAMGGEIFIFPLSLYCLRHAIWSGFHAKLRQFAFRFSFPSLLMQIFGWGQSRVGRYVLSFSGLEASVGLYGVAQNFSQNYGAVVRPVKLVSSGLVSHALEDDAESPYFMEFYHGISCIALAVAFLCAMFLGDLMKLVIAPDYWKATLALPPLIFGLYMEEMFTVYHSLMFRYFKVWFDFMRTLIAFPVVALVTIVLVPRIGFVGAAFGQLIGGLAMWIYAHVYSQRVTRRPYRFGEKMFFMFSAYLITTIAQLVSISISVKLLCSSAYILIYGLFYWTHRNSLFPRLYAKLKSEILARGEGVNAI